MKLFLAYAIYPLTLLVAGLAYVWAYQLTHLPLVGTYVGVSLSAIIIFSSEIKNPLHREWIPNRDDLISDIFFYALIIQLIFPLSLYFLGIGLLEILGFKNGIIIDLWPHRLPLLVQFLILAVCGEFFQYWWHRACHTFRFLWPIHAPHHFPHKLYSWNTSRFHFLDKFVEFIFTVFIFFMIGLSLQVFSIYYLFYALTGYAQHSNLDTRFGWFDYLIASGETHRFHHDSNLEKSKCNYANNFVLFDLLFNTFKRNPLEKNAKVGVRSKNRPNNLKEETIFPFSQMKIILFKYVLKKSMELVGKIKVEKLRNSTLNPEVTQSLLLFKIIKQNQKTIFGKEHGFKNIKTIEDYKTRVPIRDYEGHVPYLNLLFSGEKSPLNSVDPFYFTKTSGTTGVPKYIPINKQVQQSYINSQQILSHSLYQKDSRFLDGEIFSVVGNAVEEILYDKWPCGSMSGKLYSLAHRSIKAKHIFQKEISVLNDSDQKYMYLAALALLSPETTFYVSPNPSTLLKIFEVINSKRDELIVLIGSQNNQILKRHSHKFNHALFLLKAEKNLTIEDVWPNLYILTLWKEGSCSYLIPQVKKLIGPRTQICELGYLCSEFYGSLPVDSNTNIQIPTLRDNYFEFIEKEKYESGSRETLGLHELKVNSEYYIVVTTVGCFYRYFINDIIKVTGFFEKTPTIVFSQKGKGITNITGEKIAEKQLVSFFEQLNIENATIEFFICLADQEAQSYTLYLECNGDIASIDILSHQLDQYLRNVNIEYASKVSDSRLGPIVIKLLQNGTSDIYRNHCLSKGQREAQFKFLHLQYLKDVDFPFENYQKKYK